MKKITTIIIGMLITLFVMAFPQNAQANVAGSSAAMANPPELLEQAEDNRVQILHEYLASKRSPLADHAATFVMQADTYNLDWRLVAAISGLESSFGQRIPVNSYNGWGYGVYGDNVRRFASWDEGITVVSQALREDYMTKWKATTVPEIGRIYAASPTWAERVQYFLNDIEAFEQKRERTTLALSL
ncbi:MAG TPA: hypothetical protein VLF20_04875 [Patescibacteria group bacterium]|nr:hypothetical protein [Patescibacteria group bacterium]